MPGGQRGEVCGRGCIWLEWLLQAWQGEVACRNEVRAENVGKKGTIGGEKANGC